MFIKIWAELSQVKSICNIWLYNVFIYCYVLNVMQDFLAFLIVPDRTFILSSPKLPLFQTLEHSYFVQILLIFKIVDFVPLNSIFRFSFVKKNLMKTSILIVNNSRISSQETYFLVQNGILSVETPTQINFTIWWLCGFWEWWELLPIA